MKVVPIIISLNSIYFCHIENKEKLFVMTLKNILSILAFLFITFACSTEDDILNNGNAGAAQSDNGYVNLSFNLKSSVVNTRGSSEEVDNDDRSRYSDAITDCMVFLFDGDKNIVGKYVKNYEYPGVDVDELSEDLTILTKVRDNMSTLVILNYSPDFKEELDKCDTYEDIMSKEETIADYRVVSSSLTTIPTIANGSLSTNDAPKVNVDLNLSLRVAYVSVGQFTVRYVGDGDNKPDVQLTGIWLGNLKSSCYLGGEGNTIDNSKKLLGYNNTFPVASGFITPEKYSEMACAIFPNTNATSPVTMYLEFSVNGIKDTREYVINPEREGYVNPAYVNAGYWYELYITVNVDKNVDLKIDCYTKDWIPEDVQIDLE